MATKPIQMKPYLQKVKDKIIKDLVDMLKREDFLPKIYIGKTEDFSESAQRHFKEGYPILLQIAEGNAEEVSQLEDSLISWAQKDTGFTCLNKNRGSGGNPFANKLYICLDSSVKGDDLYEIDELILLGKEYPLNLKDLRNETKDK